MQEFRSSYLDDLLKIYFDVFNQYLVDAQITLTFNEFSKEFYQRRHFAFALGLQVHRSNLKVIYDSFKN